MNYVFSSCMSDELVSKISLDIYRAIEDFINLDCFKQANNFQLLSQYRRLYPLEFRNKLSRENLTLHERMHIEVQIKVIYNVLWDRGLNVYWDYDNNNYEVKARYHDDLVSDYYEEYDEILTYRDYVIYKEDEELIAA